jgi:hypothetical protein
VAFALVPLPAPLDLKGALRDVVHDAVARHMGTVNLGRGLAEKIGTGRWRA